MTVNPIVTPVPSMDDAAASIETLTTRSHEENECCRWFSRLMAGESLDDADIQRLKSKDSSEETMIPLLDRRLLESSLAEANASSSSTTTAGQFQLVRVRGGFCQDMFQSEYFETSSSSSNTNSPSLAERTPLFITPIPFSTPWFRNYLLSSENNLNVEHRDKRIRPNASACSSSKMMMDHNDKPPSATNDDDDAADTTALSSSWWNPSTMKSDPDQVPVLAELYYDQYRWNNGSSNKVRLNDIVEMIGILEYSSSCCSSDGEDSEQDAEMKDDNNNDSVAPADMEIENTAFWDDHEETPKAPNSIPRLHVIWFRSLDFDSIAAQALCCHSSSIVPPPAAVPADNYANDEAASRILAAALSIDQVSASAIYLNLLSMAERQQASSSAGGAPVVNKTPQGTTLGCSSLNLVLPNHEACSQLQQALEQVLSQLVPAVNSIHLFGRNSLALLPTQKRGRIEPTLLQLPQGATLILNTSAATTTTTAALDPSTSQALEMLTSNHHLPYQFDGGMTIPFEADVRVIVLSVAAAAGSSKLPCTMQAACSFTGMNNDASPNFHLSEQDATFLRQSLTRARSGVDWQAKNIGLPKAVLERAQQDFIQRRTAFREQKESGAKSSISSSSGLPGEGELHRWLTWTRLLARQRRGNKLTGSGARGQDTAVAATIQDWERALVLDDALVDSMSTTGKK